MTRQAGQRNSRTREIIGDLFNHPPVNEAELKQRIESVDANEARLLVVNQLEQSNVPDRSGPLFLAIIGHLGVGRQKRRLTGIALDVERNSRERLWAAMALTSEDPKTMDLLISELGSDGMGILAELSLLELLTIQDAGDIGSSIATALNNLLEDRPVDELLSRIESCRHGIGVSCATAYGEALTGEHLASIRVKILDLFVQEASDEGIELLLRLRDKSATDDDRRDFQAALLKLRSRRIDPSHLEEDVGGSALVSNCDGQGDFIVLGVFENPDETLTVTDLCLRAGGDVRDGVIYPRRRPAEAEELLSDVQQQLGCFFVEVTLSEAAKLVSLAVKNAHEQNQPIPGDACQAVTLFERLRGGFRWGGGSCCSPALSVPIEKIRALLERPEYDDTWFFDLGDLGGGSVDPPSNGETPQDWAGRMCSRLETASIRSRLVAMSEHMARWHYWNGESDTATLCRAIAGSVRKNVANSALAQAMLERSAETIEHATTELTHQFGDPSTRQHFKMHFFSNLSSPTGRDLARLDLTEASASALNAAFDLLPVERRPRDEHRDCAAYALGTIFADHVVIWRGAASSDQTVQEMSNALANTCRLTESERHEVLMTVMSSLYAFVEEICAICPVDCLKRPDDDVSEIFFTPEHPLAPARK
ncbi:MAG: hypothetical protein GY847_28070 [Proteobacteria bacterium]|nr:hypothetical protein [Pseudomonadota bacterium]